MTALDDVDRRILALLQRDGRMTNAAIGTEVGLTAPSVFERVRKLEQRGVIRGYTALVDAAALGKTLTALIRLTVQADEKYDRGLRGIAADPDVLELYNVAGEDCLVIKAKVASPMELEALIRRIRRQITVQRSVTMIALSTLKENSPVNVEASEGPVKSTRVRSPN